MFQATTIPPAVSIAGQYFTNSILIPAPAWVPSRSSDSASSVWNAGVSSSRVRR